MADWQADGSRVLGLEDADGIGEAMNAVLVAERDAAAAVAAARVESAAEVDAARHAARARIERAESIAQAIHARTEQVATTRARALVRAAATGPAPARSVGRALAQVAAWLSADEDG